MRYLSFTIQGRPAEEFFPAMVIRQWMKTPSDVDTIAYDKLLGEVTELNRQMNTTIDLHIEKVCEVEGTSIYALCAFPKNHTDLVALRLSGL